MFRSKGSTRGAWSILCGSAMVRRILSVGPEWTRRAGEHRYWPLETRKPHRTAGHIGRTKAQVSNGLDVWITCPASSPRIRQDLQTLGALCPDPLVDGRKPGRREADISAQSPQLRGRGLVHGLMRGIMLYSSSATMSAPRNTRPVALRTVG